MYYRINCWVYIMIYESTRMNCIAIYKLIKLYL